METLIIWQLRGVAPSSEVLLFTRKMLCQWNRRFSGTCSKRVPRVCVHQHFGLFWPLVSCSIDYFAMKKPVRRGPYDGSESADKGDIQLDYSSDML